ncbi:unnamed protein product [Polarella glacialis]|uniref:Uncharacterized protein n=1 Tax=Polarella glacialis TaxID=89957 RepID=A0A813LPF4_POLGL|nr:unnamed protein product [Polarella glacialis]CAE8734833.1 unnamed protein product [Polarella glacialis]
MTQMQSVFTTIFWNQVDVYDEAVCNTTVIGYWTDVDLLFRLFSQYVYFDSSRGGAVLEAWQPWGFYMGKRFHLWRCAGAGVEYFIEEDWWARPRFNWDASTKFNIKKSTGEIVATSQHKISNVWSFGQAAWEGTIESPSGDLIAVMKQDPPWSSGFMSLWIWRKWYTKNLMPDLLPNEVVSFLAAVYDIDNKREMQKNT